METYSWAMAMLPNLMVAAATNPGEALVQRVTYQVAQTANDGPKITLIDFSGLRNLMR